MVDVAIADYRVVFIPDWCSPQDARMTEADRSD